jgi:hypothetical protein
MAAIDRTRYTVHAVPPTASRTGCYANEYGKRGDVLRCTDSGAVYVVIHTDPSGAYPCWRFANGESFAAYRQEVDYVDREHRFPGVNPHKQTWTLN